MFYNFAFHTVHGVLKARTPSTHQSQGLLMSQGRVPYKGFSIRYWAAEATRSAMVRGTLYSWTHADTKVAKHRGCPPQEGVPNISIHLVSLLLETASAGHRLETQESPMVLTPEIHTHAPLSPVFPSYFLQFPDQSEKLVLMPKPAAEFSHPLAPLKPASLPKNLLNGL